MNQFTYSRPPPRRTRCHLRYAFGSIFASPLRGNAALSAFTIYSLTLVISCSPVPASILLRMLHVRGHHARTTPPRDSHSERACDARSSHTSHFATRFTLGPPRTSESFLPLPHACIILCMKQFGASIMPPSCLHAPRRAATAAGGAAPSIAPAVAPSIVPFLAKLIAAQLLLACVDVIVMTVNNDGEVMCSRLPADQSIPHRPPACHK